MKLVPYSLLIKTSLVIVLIGELLGSQLIAQDVPAQKTDQPSSRESSWSELTPDEQKQLREALREIWSDPALLSARENVNRSSHEYHAAVRELIKKQDPETAKLLDRARSGKSSEPGGKGHGGHKRHLSSLTLARLSQFIAPPSMMEKMDADQKKRFLEAGARAKEHPDVLAAMAELKALAKEEDEIRNKKMMAFRNFRMAYFEEIVNIEPDLKELIPPPGSQAPPFGKGKGGKGKGGKRSSGLSPDQGSESPPVQPTDDKVEKTQEQPR